MIFLFDLIWFFILIGIILDNLLISDSLLCLFSFGEFIMQVIINIGLMNNIISFDKVGMMHFLVYLSQDFPLCLHNIYKQQSFSP